MYLETFSVVRLITNKYEKEGVLLGAIGVILETYQDGYEVEFSREDGTTINWFAVSFDDIVLCDNQVLVGGEGAKKR